MSYNTIDSQLLSKMFLAGAKSLEAKKEWINEAKYTANNDTFDVGRTCLRACKNFSNGIKPVDCGLSDNNSIGNGSLMRMLPVSLYAYSKHLNKFDYESKEILFL